MGWFHTDTPYEIHQKALVVKLNKIFRELEIPEFKKLCKTLIGDHPKKDMILRDKNNEQVYQFNDSITRGDYQKYYSHYQSLGEVNDVTFAKYVVKLNLLPQHDEDYDYVTTHSKDEESNNDKDEENSLKENVTGMESILWKLEREFEPERLPDEDHLQAQILQFLKAKFPNSNVQREQPLKNNRSSVDIVVDGKYAIEVKVPKNKGKLEKYFKKYRQKNRKKINEYHRSDYQKNKNEIQKRHQIWFQKNKNKWKKYQQKYNKENKIKNNRRAKKYQEKNKIEAMSHYSKGTLQCKHCHIKGLEFLNIDHIHGRKTNDSYLSLIKRNFPPGLQVLCFNCNLIKEIKRKEKNWSQKITAIKVRASNSKLKLEVFSKYSKSKRPFCACCKYSADIRALTIDHIRPRKHHGHGDRLKGDKMYRFLRNSGFPPGYQVLCINCNAAKRDNRMCPHKLKKYKKKTRRKA